MDTTVINGKTVRTEEPIYKITLEINDTTHNFKNTFHLPYEKYKKISSYLFEEVFPCSRR